MGIDPCSFHFQSATPGRSGVDHISPSASSASIAIWPRCKTCLRFIRQGMIEGYCDLDVLLDPFFLHLPAPSEKRVWHPGLGCKTTKIPNLVIALSMDVSAEPWRNQYRSAIVNNSGSSITRISANSFLHDRCRVVILFDQYQFSLSFHLHLSC